MLISAGPCMIGQLLKKELKETLLLLCPFREEATAVRFLAIEVRMKAR